MSFSSRLHWLAAAITLLAIIGLWTGDGWESAWRWPAAVLLALFAFEALLSGLRKPEIERCTERSMVLGEPAQLLYRISNPLPRRLVLEFADRMPEGLSGEDLRRTLTLNPGEQFLIEHPLRALRLQPCDLEPLRVRVLGAAGLVWWPARLPAEHQVRVVTQSLSTAEIRSGNRHRGSVEQRRSGSGLELLALRDYQHGDPPRSLDWKATARRGTATVRVFSEDAQLELCLMLDCGQRSRLASGNMDRLHLGLNLAARLGQLAMGQGDSVSLIAYDDAVRLELHDLRHASGMQRLRSGLMSLRSSDREASPLNAALAADRRLKRRALIVILGDLESPRSAEQLLRAVQLLRRRHLPLLACSPDQALLRWGQSADQAWRLPYRRLAVDELLHGSRVAREKLRALGAQIVEAPVSDLDAALLRRYQFLRQRRRV